MDFDWAQLFSLSSLVNIIDIAIVSVVFYYILRVFKNTRAVQLLNGIAVIIVLKLMSSLIGLQTTEFIIDFVIQWSAIALIVIFAPEIRKALEYLGRSHVFDRSGKGFASEDERLINEIMEAVQYMARRKIGALISIERESSLSEYADTGITIDSEISNQLLVNIFIPNTPLHDGAVIIQGRRITSAASYLPLSENPSVPKKYGTRHRAAIGLSEETDAITIVVSEETGTISIANRSKLISDLDPKDALDFLKAELMTSEDEEMNWIDKLSAKFSKKGR